MTARATAAAPRRSSRRGCAPERTLRRAARRSRADRRQRVPQPREDALPADDVGQAMAVEVRLQPRLDVDQDQRDAISHQVVDVDVVVVIVATPATTAAEHSTAPRVTVPRP